MSQVIIFSPENPEVQQICSSDVQMAKLVTLIGNTKLTIRNNYFESLVFSIISQMLSSKSANVIKQRLVNLCEEITPSSIIQIDEISLKSVGLSGQKTKYIKTISTKIINNELSLDILKDLDNENATKTLVGLNGVGKWTAEMFLIFSLGRLDVMSFGDVGLQRACKWLYRMDDRKDGKYLEQKSTNWSPFRTIASLYLWQSIDNGYVDSGLSLEDIITHSRK